MTKPKKGLQNSNLTYRQKATIVKYAAANQYEISYEKLAKWATKTFDLARIPNRTTIGRILQDKDKFLNITAYDQNICRSRVIHSPALETVLVNWVLQMQHQRYRITGEMIKVKGRDFAVALNVSLQFSNG